MLDLTLVTCGGGGREAASAWRALGGVGERVRIVQELHVPGTTDPSHVPDTRDGDAADDALPGSIDLHDRATLVAVLGDPAVAGRAATAALRAGRSVAIDRPYRLTTHAIESLVSARRDAASDVQVLPLLPLRSHPAWAAFREAIVDGAMGVCRSLSVQRLVGDAPRRARERSRDEADARWTHHHGEIVDLVLWCFDRPTQVACSGVVGLAGGIEHSNTLYRLPRHDAPAEVVAETATDLPASFESVDRYLAVFEHGVMDYDASRSPPLRRHDDRRSRAHDLPDVDPDRAAAEQAVRTIDDPTAPAARIEDALAVVQLLEAERRSITRGEPVEVRLRGV
jgi:predicted dehydrogenase